MHYPLERRALTLPGLPEKLHHFVHAACKTASRADAEPRRAACGAGGAHGLPLVLRRVLGSRAYIHDQISSLCF